jgi:hypothetical protein
VCFELGALNRFGTVIANTPRKGVRMTQTQDLLIVNAKALAAALGGEVSGGQIRAPGPGHSASDRSMSVRLDSSAPNGFVVNSFGGNDAMACRDYVREKMGLPAWTPNRGEFDFRLGNLGRPSGTWTYHDASGNDAFVVARYETAATAEAPAGKTFRQWTPTDTGRWNPKGMNGARPLYRLPGLIKRPDAPALVVEGEKKAERAAIRFLDNVVTTSAAGAKSAHKTDWTPLRGRHVTIWPDNDAPGAGYAENVARLALAAGALSVRVVDIPAGWPVGWDLGDELPEGVTEATLAEMLATARLVEMPRANAPQGRSDQQGDAGGGNVPAGFGHNSDGPMPLVREMPSAEPYPIEALGPVLGGMAKALCEEAVQSPLALCGTSVLAAAALAVQGHVDVMLPTGQSCPTSLFFLSIAKSGERKSSTDNRALAPVGQYEKELRDVYEGGLPAYRNELDAWKSEREKIVKNRKLGLKEKEFELNALGAEPEPPLFPLVRYSDVTIEGVTTTLRKGHPSVGVYTSEGGQFVGGHAFSDDAKRRTAASLNKLWDGAPLDRVRAGSEPIILTGRRVSIHLQAQPDVARIMLTDPVLIDIGLIARFLIAQPDSTMGRRRFKETSPASQLAMIEYGVRQLRHMRRELPYAEGKKFELSPRALPLSPKAGVLWREFADYIEGTLAPGGDLEPVSGLANKSPEHAARIAAILTVFENEDATEIGVDHLGSGIDLVQYHLNEAIRLLGMAQIDNKLQQARSLLDWLRSKWGERFISLRALVTFGPSSIRDAATAKELVSVLAEHGWLVPAPRGTLIGGSVGTARASREAWEIIPVEA